MATKTLLNIQDYVALDEPPGLRYELSQGELIVTPSSTQLHNKVRDRLNAHLGAFVYDRALGEITSETDLILSEDTVRRPDVSFIRTERLEGIDLDQSPLPVAPDLAMEIVSKNDRADDLLVKVSQYLDAGARSVWLFFPKPRLAYRYSAGKREPEVRAADSGERFEEPELLPGFSLSLDEIFR